MSGPWFCLCGAPKTSGEPQEEVFETAVRRQSKLEGKSTIPQLDPEPAKVVIDPIAAGKADGDLLPIKEKLPSDVRPEGQTDIATIEKPHPQQPQQEHTIWQTQEEQQVKIEDKQPAVVAEGLQQRKLKEFLRGKPALSDISKSFADVGGRRPSLENLTLEQYVDKHSVLFDKLLAFEKDQRWVHKKSLDDGLVVHQFFDEDLHMAAIKGTIDMNCGKHGGLEYLLEAMLTPANRPKYDDTCISGKMVEQRLPHYRVSYFQIATPSSIISNRDVLLLGRLKFLEDGTLLVAAESMEHPDMPVNPDFIRLNLPSTGYIFRPTKNPDVYKVTFLVVAEPGGWLPGWLKRMVAWKQALTLSKFKQKYNL